MTVPTDRVWTAKDDARYVSPIVALPGYRHTIGMGRSWLRLRVENQLGFKMVKWIREIRFVESTKEMGKGYGGVSEDEEYFDLLPYI